jgi:8-oxo-dGTP diphosphatase
MAPYSWSLAQTPGGHQIYCFRLKKSLAGSLLGKRPKKMARLEFAAIRPPAGRADPATAAEADRPCSNMEMLQVVAGIVRREDRILICRRTPQQSHPLKWEFPGGKVEPGETPARAIERELEEELDIRGVTSEEITRYEYAYPGKNPILLIFLRVKEFTGEPRNRIFHEIRWEPVPNLAAFDFLEGDRDFIREYSG